MNRQQTDTTTGQDGPSSTRQPIVPPGPTPDKPYGPWMLVQKRGRKPVRSFDRLPETINTKQVTKESTGTNRFAALETTQDEQHSVVNPLFTNKPEVENKVPTPHASPRPSRWTIKNNRAESEMPENLDTMLEDSFPNATELEDTDVVMYSSPA